MDPNFLRMRRSSMKLSAVIAHSTDPNETSKIVSIVRGLPSRSFCITQCGCSTWSCRVGAVAAHETPVLVAVHRSKFESRPAVRAKTIVIMSVSSFGQVIVELN